MPDPKSTPEPVGAVGPYTRLRHRWREWLYRRLRGAALTMLTRQFLHEMLASKTRSLRWTVSMDYSNGIRDVLVMTVTCDKAESTEQ